MPQIVPKSKAPGADFCGVDDYSYIIRSDLGCYMKSSNFNEGEDLQVFKLHDSCRGGDHYLAHEDDHFYIIKGDNYRRVTNMNKDDGAITHSLHPNCRGGDHYLSAFGHFYIVFQEAGVYRKVTNMNTDEDAVDYTLHPECKNGLYYWGAKNYYYFVKPHGEGGVQYYRCTNFHENLDAVTYSFHGSVVPFIPGGLAINEGPAFRRWVAIKTISNDSDTVVRKKITKKVGYNKMKMDTVVKAWNISMGDAYKSGDLGEDIARHQFSLTAEYGGISVNTEEEDWSETAEVYEVINEPLMPKSQMYVWQYQLGFGQEPVLFCRDLKFTNDSTPPTTIPLPPSGSMDEEQTVQLLCSLLSEVRKHKDDNPDQWESS